MDAVKVPACGSVIQIDFSGGFIVMGLTDSITLPPVSKAVNETPDLSCKPSADVGQEEVSQSTFDQYWDPQDIDHALVDTNFAESIDDLAKRDITVQVVSPTYTTGALLAAPATVTFEYKAQIVSIAPEALTPQGYYKRSVTLLRTSDITKTVA